MCHGDFRQAEPKYRPLGVKHLSVNKHTNGRYQTYYLPCFAVDKNAIPISSGPPVKTFIQRRFIAPCGKAAQIHRVRTNIRVVIIAY